jgi:hypothetical protein
MPAAFAGEIGPIHTAACFANQIMARRPDRSRQGLDGPELPNVSGPWSSIRSFFVGICENIIPREAASTFSSLFPCPKISLRGPLEVENSRGIDFLFAISGRKSVAN